MGQFTTMAAQNNTSFYIVKYLLLFVIVLNILGSVWVGIYNKNAVDRAEILYPNDRWTGDKGEGSVAQVWEKLCITFLVFENIANMMGMFGALQEHYCISIIYSIIMFGSALYGAAARYIRGSVCSYLLPFIVGLVSGIFAHQIRMDNYELANTEIREVKVTPLIPTTPLYKPPLLPKPILKKESPNSSPEETKPKSYKYSSNGRNGSITSV